MIIRQEEGADYVSVEHRHLKYKRHSASNWEVWIETKWYPASLNGTKDAETTYQNQSRAKEGQNG